VLSSTHRQIHMKRQIPKNQQTSYHTVQYSTTKYNTLSYNARMLSCRYTLPVMTGRQHGPSSQVSKTTPADGECRPPVNRGIACTEPYRTQYEADSAVSPCFRTHIYSLAQLWTTWLHIDIYRTAKLLVAALRSRSAHYIFALLFLSSFYLFSFLA